MITTTTTTTCTLQVPCNPIALGRPSPLCAPPLTRSSRRSCTSDRSALLVTTPPLSPCPDNLVPPAPLPRPPSHAPTESACPQSTPLTPTLRRWRTTPTKPTSSPRSSTTTSPPRAAHAAHAFTEWQNTTPPYSLPIQHDKDILITRLCRVVLLWHVVVQNKLLDAHGSDDCQHLTDHPSPQETNRKISCHLCMWCTPHKSSPRDEPHKMINRVPLPPARQRT